MLEPQTSSVLVDFYEGFLRDQDIEHFRRQVASRYTEGTLARVIESGSTPARRAAVLALGLLGTYDASNGVVARALRDTDPTVRTLAMNALWAIWFRADTPENNATLERVRELLGQERSDDAIDLADKLIGRAPKFAEAYNQRAIAYFLLGRFDESAADCRRVLELNPYHTGALGGLAQCQLRLNQRQEAIKTLRRWLKLQPFSEGLRERIVELETLGD
jgi:tetratricopeptide (TPR) repeat protein